MSEVAGASGPQAVRLPTALTFRDARSYVLTGVFVLLSVAVPALLHRYPLAGPVFLPMHFFVLTAGLAFGWRAGLLVGLSSPLASFLVSGLPVAPVLPRITAELSAYGLVAGLLREKWLAPAIWSLVGAMIAGRLVMVLGVLASYALAVPDRALGLAATPLEAAWATVKQGWPGAASQLVLIPALLALAGKVWRRASERR